MELGGDEKKIQALFSELSLENQSVVPQFEHLWTGARSAVAPPREKTFIRPLAVLVSLLVTAAAGALTLWTWDRLTASSTANIANYVPKPAPVEVLYQPTPVKIRETLRPIQRKKHVLRKRQTDRSVMAEARLLSNWQSPTQRFMQSPAAVALDSLPQLNQSVKDLESFLPKKTEIMKESNR